jgi:hypothetical protein
MHAFYKIGLEKRKETQMKPYATRDLRPKRRRLFHPVPRIYRRLCLSCRMTLLKCFLAQRTQEKKERGHKSKKGSWAFFNESRQLPSCCQVRMRRANMQLEKQIEYL